eukprot:8922772-Karenia_brevis.AAC.1
MAPAPSKQQQPGAPPTRPRAPAGGTATTQQTKSKPKGSAPAGMPPPAKAATQATARSRSPVLISSSS